MPKLSQISYNNLRGVNPLLIQLVERAITGTPIDFRVTEGLRTLSRQKYLVSIGASETLDSKHITGDAIDIVPWIDHAPVYKWPLIYTLAEHMRSVAKELDIKIRWGGLFKIGMSFTSTVQPVQDLVESEIAKARANGKRIFLDGPHYELCDKRSL